MRHLLVCLAVAALAGPALAGVCGHTGIIDITTPGAVLAGDHWAIPGPLLTPFYVDIYVSCTHPVGMSSFAITLTGPAGLCYAASSKGGRNYCGYYALADGRGLVDNGWDQANGVTWPGGCFPPGPMVGTVNQGPGWPVPWGINGWAAWVKMISGTAPVGSTIGGINPGIGDANYDSLLELNITVRPLLITPEPVSALLLLAGLPLLRRRR